MAGGFPLPDSPELDSIRKALPTLNPDLLRRFLTFPGAVALIPARHFDLSLGNLQCGDRVALWLLAGRARTGQDGTVTIPLNDYLCNKDFTLMPDDSEDESFLRSLTVTITGEPWFVATPIASSPAVLASSSTMTEVNAAAGGLVPFDPVSNPIKAYQVDITVTSWGLDGNPRPNVDFSWHCLVEGARWFFIGG